MNPFLLDALYVAGLFAASPYFLYRMATTGKYRSGLAQRLGIIPPRGDGECIWLHGVSVGEILAARSIVGAMEAEFPGEQIALSTTTNTGYAVAQQHYPGRKVFYFPLDFSWAVARTFRRIRPKIVILMEMEVWPNFLHCAKALGVPVVVANGRITRRSFRNYARFGRFLRPALREVTMYLVQDETYGERLRRLGVPDERILVTGNVKFDTLSTDTDASRREGLRREMGVREDETLVIGGSTHAGEEEALLAAYAAVRQETPSLRLLVVPRHKTRFNEVARLIAVSGFEVFCRSALARGASPEGGEVILGDTMGELEALYEAADVAFVGGSLIPHGGQNILEPAAKGTPVIFGPSVENFPVASRVLLRAGAATQIDGAQGLANAIKKYTAPEENALAGRRGREALISAQGATARTIEAIKKVLKKDGLTARPS